MPTFTAPTVFLVTYFLECCCGCDHDPRVEHRITHAPDFERALETADAATRSDPDAFARAIWGDTCTDPSLADIQVEEMSEIPTL